MMQAKQAQVGQSGCRLLDVAAACDSEALLSRRPTRAPAEASCSLGDVVPAGQLGRSAATYSISTLGQVPCRSPCHSASAWALFPLEHVVPVRQLGCSAAPSHGEWQVYARETAASTNARAARIQRTCLSTSQEADASANARARRNLGSRSQRERKGCRRPAVSFQRKQQPARTQGLQATNGKAKARRKGFQPR